MIFCKLFARPITEKLEHQLQLPMITNYCSKKGRDRRVQIKGSGKLLRKFLHLFSALLYSVNLFLKMWFINNNFFLKMYAC